MSSSWVFQVRFNADDQRDAEDYAARLVDLVEAARRGRTSLAYLDPITGEFRIWAEPARSSAELELGRSPI
jgi:hypothetical protein